MLLKAVILFSPSIVVSEYLFASINGIEKNIVAIRIRDISFKTYIWRYFIKIANTAIIAKPAIKDKERIFW